MNGFNAKCRALLRMARRVEINKSLRKLSKKFDMMCATDAAAVVTMAADPVYMETQKIWQDLEYGGCGDIEETVCKKDGAHYSVENCKACQEEYIAMRDKELSQEKEQLLNRTLSKQDPHWREPSEIIKEFNDAYDNLARMYRRYPEMRSTLLQNVKGG